MLTSHNRMHRASRPNIMALHILMYGAKRAVCPFCAFLPFFDAFSQQNNYFLPHGFGTIAQSFIL